MTDSNFDRNGTAVARLMDQGGVSALVVTYNHERYIREAVDSALAQDGVCEVIVVDDGSSDDTVRRVMAIEDVRVRLIRQVHRGISHLAETYNVGLASCRAEFVGILEGDDRWPADKCRMQLPAFADQRVVCSHGPYGVIGTSGTNLIGRVEPAVQLSPGPYDALPLHLTASYIMPVTAIIRREAIARAGGFRQLGDTVHWDWPTLLSLSEVGLFDYCADVVGCWRKHAESGTTLRGDELQGVPLSLELALSTRRRLGDRLGLPTAHVIERSWADAYARQIWNAARLHLVRGRYAHARSLTGHALRGKCSRRMRLRLALAWIASVMHVDLERVGRAFGRKSPMQDLA